MVDEVFEDEFLASLYDHFNLWHVSDDFYLRAARERGADVLDLGCGTGMLACRLAEAGLNVTGADPAEGMLRVARSRPGGERVSWVRSSGQDLDLPTRFDFVCMTGHAFQALLTDEDAIALLRSVRRHLKIGGCFAFESRNPAVRAWLSWTPDRRKRAQTEKHGRVEEFFAIEGDIQDGIVTIVHNYDLIDEARLITGRSRIRFVDQQHLNGLLAASDLVATNWFSDWDGSALTPSGREFIVFAEPVRARP